MRTFHCVVHCVVSAVVIGMCNTVLHTVAFAQIVRLGADVASDNDFKIFAGKKLGLIVNHSSVNAKGEHLADVLAAKKLAVKLFAPEHGVRGEKDEENLKDETDAKTGLPIISLYKGDKKAPSEEDLKGVDALVFDIQEIGVRYYTYSSTMALAMKAAAKAGIEFYVLDRPNPALPLGAYGPILDKDLEGGFVSMYPITMAHGMTIGELAKFYNEEFGIKCKLTVVSMQNYSRTKFFDELGLAWRNPSPNIRSMEALLAYQVFGWMEYWDISVGRGTDTPFLLFGMPGWVGGKVALEFQELRVSGCRFTPASFTPTSSKHKDKLCGGIRLAVTEHTLIEPLQAAATVGTVMLKMMPDSSRAKAVQQGAKLLGSKKVIETMLAGIRAKKDVPDIVADVEKIVQPQMKAFADRSKKYWLYQ